jgi:hypothetical protein
MVTRIKNDRAEELARPVAAEAGASSTDAVTSSEGGCSGPDLAEALMQIGRRCSALPDLDARDADEILGYAGRDEHGTQALLGSRLAERFAGLGLEQEIPELRGQPARPADFES